VLVVMAATLVFNRNGLFAIASLERTADRTRSSIDSLGGVVDSLRTEVQALQTDSVFMEKAVREVLGWGRPGEFIIRIVSPGEGGS
jgi:cell division protein FtsB